MQVTCSACGKRLQIPDDKLPTDRQVRITCPACHERFTFDPLDATPPAACITEPMPSPTAEPTTLAQATSTPAAGTSLFMVDIAEAGPAPRALICLDTASHRDECESMLPSLGYNTVHVMPHMMQALTYLTQVSYDFVMLDTTFDGSSPEANPILACLYELSMDRRRKMFVTLCTQGSGGADTMTAYSQSVNLIISHADVLTCRRILQQHLDEHKRLYSVYRELCQECGRD